MKSFVTGRDTSVALCEGQLCLADDIANSANEEILRKRTFTCTTCPEEHRVYYKRTKHFRYAKDSHFSHAPSAHGNHNDENSTGAQNHTRGESEEHLQGKALLQKYVGFYHFIVEKCKFCKYRLVAETEIDCAVLVEKRMIVGENNSFIYDTLLVHGANQTPICVMEVYNTHKTSQDKINKTRASGLKFAEFTVDNLEKFREFLTSPKGATGTPYMLTNLKPEMVCCNACSDNAHMRVSEAVSACSDLEADGDHVMHLGTASLLDTAQLLVVLPHDLLRRLIRDTREKKGCLSSVLRQYLDKPTDSDLLIQTLETYVIGTGGLVDDQSVNTDVIAIPHIDETEDIKLIFDSYSCLSLKLKFDTSQLTPWQMDKALLQNISPDVDWRLVVLWTCLLQYYQEHTPKDVNSDDDDIIEITTPESPKKMKDYWSYIKTLENTPRATEVGQFWDKTAEKIQNSDNPDGVFLVSKALWSACFNKLFSYQGIRAMFEKKHFMCDVGKCYYAVEENGTLIQYSCTAMTGYKVGKRYWEVLGPNKKTISLTSPSLENGFRPKSFVTQWMKDESARTYSHIDTIPPSRQGSSVPNNVYNTWKGFRAETLQAVPVEQVGSLVEPILNHLRIIMDKPEYYDYLVAWLAQIVQDPSKPTNVAILLKGLQGAGKNIVFDFFVDNVLGHDTALQTGNPQMAIFGPHSVALQNRVLVIMNELKDTDIRPLMPRLKDLITSTTVHINPKNKSAYDVRNLSNFIATTNDKNPLHIEPQERRFVVFDCSASKIGDAAYFGSLYAHLSRDDVARAFFQYLRDMVDVKAFTPFQAFRPKTDAYITMQQRNIPVFYKFLSAELEYATGVEGETHGKVGAKCFFVKFLAWAREGNHTVTNYTNSKFGTEVAELITEITSTDKTQTTFVKHRFKDGVKYKVDWNKLRVYLQKTTRYDANAADCVV